MGTVGRLVFVAFVVAALLALAGCSGSAGNDGSVNPNGSPEEEAESAGFPDVHSGEVEIAVWINRLRPGHPEAAKIQILGTFWGLGKGGLPHFDMAIESNGTLDRRSLEASGGLLYGGDYAVANYEEQTYEPDQSTLDEIKSKIEEAQQEGDVGNVRACVEAAEGLGLGSVAKNLQRLPNGETIDGTPAIVINAEVDVSGAIDALIQMMEDPACGTQLQDLGAPSSAWLRVAERSLAGRIGQSQGQLLFDKQGVIRDLFARVWGRNAQDESINVALSIKLLRVNEPDVSPATYGEVPLQPLLKKFGADEAMIAKADGGEIMTSFFRGIVDMVTGREHP